MCVTWFFINAKGYIVYNLSQQKLLVSRDVIFKEEVYSFASQKDKQHVPLYPNIPLDDSECDYEVSSVDSVIHYEQEGAPAA